MVKVKSDVQIDVNLMTNRIGLCMKVSLKHYQNYPVNQFQLCPELYRSPQLAQLTLTRV